MRKFLARLFLPFFIVWCVLIPRTAYAFVPQAVYLSGVGSSAELLAASAAAGGVPGFTSASASLAGAGAFGIGLGALALGAALGYLIVDQLSDGSLTRIPLTDAQSVPAPAAPVTAAPTSSGGTNCTYYGFSGLTTSADSACASGCNGPYGAPTYTSCSYTVVVDHQASGCLPALSSGVSCKFIADGYTINQTLYSGDAIATPAECPGGYTLNGTSCVLQDARTAQPDHSCDYQRSAGLVPINDPDCPATPVVQNGRITGTDQNGNPIVTTITPRTSGGTDIVINTQRTVGSSTVVDTVTIGVSQTGTVDSLSGSTQTGNITIPTDGTAPTVNTGQQVQPTSIEFPTDYARTGEAASAAAPLAQESTQVQIRDALTVDPAQTPPYDPQSDNTDITNLTTPPDFNLFDGSSLNGVIPLPISSGGCTPFETPFMNSTISWNLCPAHAAFHSYIDYGFGFMGAVLTYRVLMGRREEG